MAIHAGFDYFIFPLLLPFIALWLLLARILSFVAPFTIVPTIILAKRLNWAVPVAPVIWKERGFYRGFWQRVGFEATYCMNVVRRFLTLPLRPYTPHFYILGFPKCGTPVLASYLTQHPGFRALDGLPWHPVLNKESHFFNGSLGRWSASSPTLYRSFFPTVVTRWWVECVRRAGGWWCFDACPVTACLPYAAKRIAAINPNAKLVFLVRDPVEAAFSVEIMVSLRVRLTYLCLFFLPYRKKERKPGLLMLPMAVVEGTNQIEINAHLICCNPTSFSQLRNIGMNLEWSFMEDVMAADPRFADSPDDVRFWEQLAGLGIDDPLPVDLPARLYGRCSTILRCAKYTERVKPFLEHFPKEK